MRSQQKVNKKRSENHLSKSRGETFFYLNVQIITLKHDFFFLKVSQKLKIHHSLEHLKIVLPIFQEGQGTECLEQYV